MKLAVPDNAVSDATTLSQVIRLALKDLTKVEKSPKYVINMSRWHHPKVKWNNRTMTETLAGKCEICLAGAVIAKSLKASPSEQHDPADYNKTLSRKLQSLNMIRTGYVREAVETFYGWHTLRGGKNAAKCDGIFPEADGMFNPEVKVAEYSKRASDKFKRQLLDIADKLESIGL